MAKRGVAFEIFDHRLITRVPIFNRPNEKSKRRPCGSSSSVKGTFRSRFRVVFFSILYMFQLDRRQIKTIIDVEKIVPKMAKVVLHQRQIDPGFDWLGIGLDDRRFRL
jgi:hypothetical protein